LKVQGSKVQGLWVQRFRGSGFMGSDVQRFRVYGFRGSEVQGSTFRVEKCR
jgi:hypothetical protein